MQQNKSINLNDPKIVKKNSLIKLINDLNSKQIHFNTIKYNLTPQNKSINFNDPKRQRKTA